VVRCSKTPENEAVLRAFKKCQSLYEESLDMTSMADLHEFLRHPSKVFFQEKCHRRRMLWEIVEEIQCRQISNENMKSGLLRMACEEISHFSVMLHVI
jgi:hypothetical protein